MSHRHYINELKGDIRHVIPASEMIDLMASENASPFIETSWFEKRRKWILRGLIKITEIVTGQTLYLENHLRELASIEPRTRALLLFFIKKGYIKSWTIDVVSQIKSYIVGVTFEISNFPTKSGKLIKLIGASGCGTGYTMNQALIPALAELAERYASVVFKEKSFTFGSEESLKTKPVVSLENFSFFTEEQKRNTPELQRNTFNRKTQLHWITANHLNSNKKCLIPAQLIYGFLSYVKLDEPVFFETNSNGTAAHTHPKEAATRALLEVIERDAFLFYWLKKIPPTRIRKETIQSIEIQTLIKNIESQSFKLTILCINTEFGLPTIVSVISGSRNRTFVFAGAACEFSLEKALRKSLFEAARMAQFYTPATQEEINSSKEKYPFFTTFKERYAWWSLPENQEKITPFLSGEEISCSEVAYPVNSDDDITPIEKYNYLRNLFIKNGIDAYTVDITPKEIRDIGLYVQKAVAPKLIPAYFKEYAKPLGLKRLSLDNNPLQTIPHPFL